jgi:hypothetical protein
LDIFVDTGVIFGYSSNGDTFFPYCQKLFEGREFRDNKYYTTVGIVKREIERIKDARLQGFKNPIRLFILKASNTLEKLSDVSMGNHPKYRELTDNIHAFLLMVRKDKKRKQCDSILLSNSHLWSISYANLITPYFLTTDKIDIFDNRPKISQIASNCLSLQCPIEIDYIPYFIQKETAN